MALQLDGENIFKNQEEPQIQKRPKFTSTKSNRDIVIVNENVAITGYINIQAIGVGEEEQEMGYESIYSIKNESGGNRNVDITITNQTKGTTLFTHSTTLGDGAFRSESIFHTIEEIDGGDYLRLTIGNQGIGTALGSATLASFSYEIKNIFISQNG